jgi:diguanylate cyclase (GGDEF)-like protein
MESLQRLEERLHEPLPVGERVSVLNEISEHLYERDAERGARLARESMELARAIDDGHGQAQALYCLGRNLYSQADYPGVFETQHEALMRFTALADRAGEARVRNLLGITHQQLSDYGEAISLYDLALQGFRETGDKRWEARVLSNIGNIEIRLGNLAEALELFDQALTLRREVGDQEGAGFDLNNAAFGHVQRAQQHRQSGDRERSRMEAENAVRLLDRALTIARDQGYKRLEAFCLQTMGEAYQAMGRPEVALGMAGQFLELARDSNDRWIEAYGLACLGEIRAQMGEPVEGIAQLRQASDAFEALGSRDEVARVQRIISAACELRGDLAAALASLKRAGVIEQGLRTEEAEMKARTLAVRRRLDHANLETERYRKLAMEDSLTGLANRRQLDQKLDELLAQVRGSGGTIAVAIADVDHFKGINDRFSHATGDEVLKRVGDILREHCRTSDVAGRYGGEEFVLVFLGLDMRAAAEVCERVRRGVESCDWNAIHDQLRVTLSIGLATSASFPTPQGLLDAADHWLYQAKHRGRNQVQPAMMPLRA